MTPVSPERLSPAAGERRPVPVEVRTPAPTAIDQLQGIIGVVLAPLATAGLVLLFVLFLLLQREDVRDRAIRLLGSNDLEKSTTAMDDAGKRLGRYFLTLTLINIGFGMFIALGLWLIGVPSPVLWGVLATLMRFVPFLGSFIAAACPLILAAAVDPGWSMFLMTLALYVVSEPIMGNVIEPVVQGQRTGLSPLAIVLSAAFWTLLWGPIGLLLAIPLTVVLVVLGHHVERLEFLNVLLGDKPPLSPAERFYQRMLAGDPAEAVEQAETFIKDRSRSSTTTTTSSSRPCAWRRPTPTAARWSPIVCIDIRNTADVVIDTLEDYDLTPKKAPKPQKSVIEEASEDDAELPRCADTDADRRRKDTARRRAEEKEKDKEEEEEELALDLCTVGGGAIDPAWRNENAHTLRRQPHRARRDGRHGIRAARQQVRLERQGRRRRPPAPRRAVGRGRRGHAPHLHLGATCARRAPMPRFLVRRLKRSAPNALLLGCFWKLDPEDSQDKDILDEHSRRRQGAHAAEAVSLPARRRAATAGRRGERPAIRRDAVVVRAAS